MSYDALDKHEIECDYQLKQCPGCELQMLKKEFNTHESSCELIPLTCEDCKFTYKKNEVATKHTENMCLKKQLKGLKHEYKEIKTEIQKLNSQLTEMRQLTSKILISIPNNNI
jgi:UDP-N-acetylenolpyruvoylglucosamine reductase